MNNTPEMIDLGLPSGNLWAKCNIGAETETEVGKYFAWGDAEAGKYFTWGDIERFEASEASGRFNSYWYAERPGKYLKDDITDNDAVHNAAFAAYGVGYTMPSDIDFRELIIETKNEWTYNYKDSGVAGWIFTGNGNTLFIPAVGFCYDGNILYTGSDGCYWSSSLLNTNRSYNLRFYNGEIYVDYNSHCYGFPVRAIKRK